MHCPIEDNATFRVFQVNGFWIRECQGCSHRCVEVEPSEEHVATVYGNYYFTEGGVGYTDYFGEANVITAHGRRYGKLLSKFMMPGKVLDVGAAAGFILKGLSETGWNGLGIEPNASMAEYGRMQMGADIEVSALEQYKSDEKFDLVTMVQVLPHFYNLRQALQNAADLTKRSGYWLVETWNKNSFIARMLGKNWHEYSPPSTLHFFSPETLNALVSQFGFEEVARGRPAKKIGSGHAKSLFQYKLQSSKIGNPVAKMMNFVPDNLVIPYPSFDLFWALYQKKE